MKLIEVIDKQKQQLRTLALLFSRLVSGKWQQTAEEIFSVKQAKDGRVRQRVSLSVDDLDPTVKTSTLVWVDDVNQTLANGLRALAKDAGFEVSEIGVKHGSKQFPVRERDLNSYTFFVDHGLNEELDQQTATFRKLMLLAAPLVPGALKKVESDVFSWSDIAQNRLVKFVLHREEGNHVEIVVVDSKPTLSTEIVKTLEQDLPRDRYSVVKTTTHLRHKTYRYNINVFW